jgi:hypothetical protein
MAYGILGHIRAAWNWIQPNMITNIGKRVLALTIVNILHWIDSGKA